MRFVPLTPIQASKALTKSRTKGRKANTRKMKQTITVERIERRPIDDLINNPQNARLHSEEQIRQIAASIAEFGFVNPVLIGPDNVIIAGHARLAAARQLALDEIPVIVLTHLTPAQRRALVIADNQLALDATWDDKMLAAELAALEADDFALELTGFDDEELARLLADADVDEDKVPDPLPEPISRSGNLWLLGNHRLLCGDATAETDCENLMAGEVGDLAFFDGPYNVDYEGYTEKRLKIQGDCMPGNQFCRLLEDSFRSYRTIVSSTASLYVCHASTWQREVQDALEAAGFEIRCQLLWVKNTFAWGFGRYKFQHEPIFYCHVRGQTDAWYGDKAQSTVWEENKPAANRAHPTAKPVGLIERALVNSSKPGDVVVDLFCGSGSTLIACERKGRKARLMEIDPRYADCIVRRWEEYTHKPALLGGDGRSFEEVRRERVKVAA
jgi:DNA modification methylase